MYLSVHLHLSTSSTMYAQYSGDRCIVYVFVDMVCVCVELKMPYHTCTYVCVWCAVLLAYCI